MYSFDRILSNFCLYIYLHDDDDDDDDDDLLKLETCMSDEGFLLFFCAVFVLNTVFS